MANIPKTSFTVELPVDDVRIEIDDDRLIINHIMVWCTGMSETMQKEAWKRVIQLQRSQGEFGLREKFRSLLGINR